MKTCRNLLLTTIVVLSCLFTLQPAGAVAVSALMSAPQECDVVGPLPHRLVAPGFGVSNSETALNNALRTAPACMQADTQDSAMAASSSLECNNIGPLMFGQGTSGLLASTAAPACMVSQNLLQPAAAADIRTCTGSNEIVLRSHSCTSPA